MLQHGIRPVLVCGRQFVVGGDPLSCTELPEIPPSIVDPVEHLSEFSQVQSDSMPVPSLFGPDVAPGFVNHCPYPTESSRVSMDGKEIVLREHHTTL